MFEYVFSKEFAFPIVTLDRYKKPSGHILAMAVNQNIVGEMIYQNGAIKIPWFTFGPNGCSDECRSCRRSLPRARIPTTMGITLCVVAMQSAIGISNGALNIIMRWYWTFLGKCAINALDERGEAMLSVYNNYYYNNLLLDPPQSKLIHSFRYSKLLYIKFIICNLYSLADNQEIRK